MEAFNWVSFFIGLFSGCIVTFLAGIISWFHMEVEKQKKEFNDSMKNDNIDYTNIGKIPK
ncbi:hypothetical protein LCGC14_1479800 [marine sediment metagenome]|uniref:Uncharacterized protein n=1 Tax=marine sediment metagenome TaxID=412755 RepID=A0A0F9HEV7_9ZZZZ